MIPEFRIPDYIVDRDESLLRDLGVNIHLSQEKTKSVSELKNLGFQYVLVGIGAEMDRVIPITGALGALAFLRDYRKSPNAVALGKDVAIIGAGDTAMDAARAATRCVGVEKVRILYRRTEAEMPATAEECEAAREDGVMFTFLRSPESWRYDDRFRARKLECRVMELGEADDSGRLRPVPTQKTEAFEVDTVISAIGQDTDLRAFSDITLGNSPDHDSGVFLIGDAATGAATIVKAIESAQKVADEICGREGGSNYRPAVTEVERHRPLRANRVRIRPKTAVSGTDDERSAIEADRCLGCRELCLKCVEVCPNRANTTIKVENELTDVLQIIHLDAFCNECGNCETFCPWNGRPYTDKFTVFSCGEDFESSANPGFFLDGKRVVLRLNGKIQEGTADTRSEAVVQAIVQKHAYLLGPVDE